MTNKVMRISLRTNGPNSSATVKVYVHDFVSGEESKLTIHEGQPLPDVFTFLGTVTSAELLRELAARIEMGRGLDHKRSDEEKPVLKDMVG